MSNFGVIPLIFIVKKKERKYTYIYHNTFKQIF